MALFFVVWLHGVVGFEVKLGQCEVQELLLIRGVLAKARMLNELQNLNYVGPKID